MEFVDGIDHLDESHDRRLRNLIEFHDLSKIDEGGVYAKFGADYNSAHTSTSLEGSWYVSHNHYLQKWDAVDEGVNGICSA